MDNRWNTNSKFKQKLKIVQKCGSSTSSSFEKHFVFLISEQNSKFVSHFFQIENGD